MPASIKLISVVFGANVLSGTTQDCPVSTDKKITMTVLTGPARDEIATLSWDAQEVQITCGQQMFLGRAKVASVNEIDVWTSSVTLDVWLRDVVPTGKFA